MADMPRTEPHPVDRAVGAAVRRRRLEMGLTQGDLAERLGVTFQQLQKYELGKNRIAASRLAAIAAALGRPPGWFFDPADPAPARGDTRVPAVDLVIGAAIEARRRQLGRDRADLARAVGVPLLQLIQIEVGAERVPVEVLAALSEALDLPIARFFGAFGESSAHTVAAAS